MVEEKVFEMAREEFGIDEINRDMDLKEDFDIDSISALEFIMDVEEEFGIEIEDEELENMTTVGNVIDYIEDHK